MELFPHILDEAGFGIERINTDVPELIDLYFSDALVSFDFQSDVTSRGRNIRFFNVIDEYTRTALAIIARRSFTASDVIAVLENVIAETGTAPTYVHCDNGPEFTAAALIDWCNTVGVGTAFIDPGSPWQNGFVESLLGKLMQENQQAIA